MHNYGLRFLICLLAVTLSNAMMHGQHDAVPVSIDDTTTFTDLAFLDQLLEGKRVVMLGEFNHGSKEINTIKFRLIRYLHEQLGYRVLLLESGIGEVHTINEARHHINPDYLRYRLTGPWHSDEFKGFMAYLARRPELNVGGIDVQRSGSSFGRFVRRMLPEKDSMTALQFIELEEMNNDFKKVLRSEITPEVIMRRDSLMTAYAHFADRIRSYQEIPEGDLEIILRTLFNRREYLRYYSTFQTDYVHRFQARDSLLAQNALWYLNEVFPDEKVIISAHNYHIAKTHPGMFTMGTILHEELGEEAYVIGFFAGSGTYANNSRKPVILDPPEGANDLKSFVLQSDVGNFFHDFSSAGPSLSQWFHAPVRMQTFIDLSDSDELVLSEWFDAAVFLKEVTPSTYD